MHTANDVLGIDEAKCLRLALRVETDAWKTAYGPARLDIFIACEPSYPEKIDAFGCWVLSFRANISDIDVKYADDSGIPVGVRVLNVLSVLVREDHHISVHAWVERVLCPPEVTCSIVDVQDFVAIGAILDEAERIALTWSKFFVLIAKQLTQYVVFQLREEALQQCVILSTCRQYTITHLQCHVFFVVQ